MSTSTMENTDTATMARQRSDIYGFLAMVYRQEVISDFLEQIKDPRFLGVLSDLGVQFDDDFLQKPEKELLEDLAIEYTRLFLGPGRHISPHESVHHEKDNSKWGQLWGDSTVEVKKFVETTGLEYQTDYKGLPDHISVELEFMQQLTLRENQAWEEEDVDGAASCRKIEKKFIEEHMVPWVPAFCDKVMESAGSGFYRGVAGLTKKFVEFENQETGR